MLAKLNNLFIIECASDTCTQITELLKLIPNLTLHYSVNLKDDEFSRIFFLVKLHSH